jgi:hypothetical protein
MRQAISNFLKSGGALNPSDRAVLETLLALSPSGDAIAMTSEGLRLELERRQGRELAPATYRQRMKRLGDALEAAKAPFRLVSAGGNIAAQPTLAAHEDESTGAFLSGHSQEKSSPALDNAVRPQAKPGCLLVMFSYAWLGDALHRIQDEFFKDLDSVLRYPPESYRHLRIRLWRDVHDIRKSRPGGEQMDAACREAFFGLLMLSNKYPHSKACMHEAGFFISPDGQNQPGKDCLIVPVNITRKDAPRRFLNGVRIWADANGRNLLEIWSHGTNAERHAFVRSVAEEIWEAAMRQALAGSSSDGGSVNLDRRIEDLMHGRRYEHDFANKAPLRAQEGQFTRDPGISEGLQRETRGIDIIPHLAEWATAPTGARLVALLGDFGMGKTVACQLLTQELLKRRKADHSVPLPVYFDLRDIRRPEAAGSSSLDELIEQMLYHSGQQVPSLKDRSASAREVIEYVRERDALIVFDGLDEVTNKLTGDQAIRLYRELLSIVPSDIWRQRGLEKAKGSTTRRGPRILVSCRTHYFKDVAAQRAFLIGQDRGPVAPDQDTKLYYLLPFSEEQISTYLGFYLDKDDVARALDLIRETYNLQELAARPIFLKFIRETLDSIAQERKAGHIINIARLYDIFIQQSLERDNPKHILPVREKRQLLADLALALHAKRRDTLANDALDDWFDEAAQHMPKLQRALAGVDSLSEGERFLQDLRNASFLVRPGEEQFRFAHTSVREYFLANAIHSAICANRIDLLDIPAISRETIGFILARQAIAGRESSDAFLRSFSSLLAEGRPLDVRRLGYALWRSSDFRLPRTTVVDLSGMDFSRDTFRGAPGRLVPLARTLWKGARLCQTEFDHVELEGADFNEAVAPMSRWLSCRMAGAHWHDADLVGSRWRHCRFDVEALGKCQPPAREWIDCRIGEEAWQTARDDSAKQWLPFQQQGHSDYVRSVALGRVGARDVIVSGGDDHTVRLWDAASGENLAVLEGHSAYVLSVALGRVGAREVIVSGGDDHTVRLWDAASGESLAVLEGHSASVLSVALGRVGARDVIVSGGSDCTVRLWDAASGESLAVLEGHSGRVLSVALGRVGARDVIVSGGSDRTVRLWDAASGENLAVLEGHSDTVLSVALGRVGARDVIVSGGDDGTVRLWDAARALSGALSATLICGPGANTLLALSPDGRGGYCVTHASADVWRHFIARGRGPDGTIVTAPIETMLAPAVTKR